MAVMEDMLQAHRDLNGVFGINDDSALGATSVLESAGRKDIVVVGYDATPEARATERRHESSAIWMRCRVAGSCSSTGRLPRMLLMAW